MERKFTLDGSAVSAVFQIAAGAKFRGVRFDPWSVRLFDGSYSGYVDRDQVEVVE